MSGPYGGIRRRPTQERSSLTVDAILAAAAELFCDIGYDRSSTNRIADRAGVSIGSLYQYFANKEAILAALFEEHRREAHSVVGKALAELNDPEVSLENGIEGLFEGLIAFHREDPELSRVLSEEVPQLTHGPSESEEIDQYVKTVVTMLQRRPEVVVANLETSAALVVTTIDALTRRFVHGSPAGFDASPHVREAVRMLVGYLTLRRIKPRP